MDEVRLLLHERATFTTAAFATALATALPTALAAALAATFAAALAATFATAFAAALATATIAATLAAASIAAAFAATFTTALTATGAATIAATVAASVAAALAASVAATLAAAALSWPRQVAHLPRGRRRLLLPPPKRRRRPAPCDGDLRSHRPEAALLPRLARRGAYYAWRHPVHRLRLVPTFDDDRYHVRLQNARMRRRHLLQCRYANGRELELLLEPRQPAKAVPGARSAP